MSLTRTLATYLSDVARTPLPADVADRTRLHLLDTLAAMVSGASLDAGRRTVDYVRGEGISDQATVQPVQTAGSGNDRAARRKHHRLRWAGCNDRRRRGTPEEVARATLFLASDDADYVTGERIMVTGGRTNL